MKYVPERLRKLVNETGISVDRLSVPIGIGTSTMHAMIKRKNYNPGLRNICKLSEYFHVPMEYFFDAFSEEDSLKLLENYHEVFNKLRRSSYEDYILAGRIINNQLYASRSESPWPYNLAESVLDDSVEYIITDEQWDRFEDTVVETAPYIAKYYEKVVARYYRDGKTLEDIGKENGVHKERIRQIINKCIRIMSHKRFTQFITSEYERMQELIKVLNDDIDILEAKKEELEQAINKLRKEQDEAIDEACKDILNTDLHDFMYDLSARSYNCLVRAGCHTIGDVYDRARKGTLTDIRNLGKRSKTEVLDFLNNKLGFEVKESA